MEAAHPSYVTLLDTAHVVSELFSTRNVPATIWIDETGRIIRPPEGVYARIRPSREADPVPNEKYLNAVRDWVKNGQNSIYAKQENALREKARKPTPEEAEAMAYFRLGVYLYQQGHGEAAIPYFKHAQELKPDNWNFKRQAWNLGDAERDYGTNFRDEAQKHGPAYDPIDLPDLPGEGA